MTSASFQDKTCEICYSPWMTSTTVEESGETLLVKRENLALLPGAEGCRSLNAHLRFYFISTRLLKLPQKELEKLVNPKEISLSTSKHGSSSTIRKRQNDKLEEYGIVGKDGHKLLYTTVCSRCESIVNEAIDLHTKMLDLQGKIEKLGKELREIKEIAHNKRKLSEEEERRALKNEIIAEDSNSTDDKQENVAAREMLGLSFACLDIHSVDKAPFPKRKVKKPISPRKLKTREKSVVDNSVVDSVDPSVTIIDDTLSSQFQNNASGNANKVQIKMETDADIMDFENDVDKMNIVPQQRQHQDFGAKQLIPSDSLEDQKITQNDSDPIIDNSPKDGDNYDDSDYLPDPDDDEEEENDDDSDSDFDDASKRNRKKIFRNTIVAESSSDDDNDDDRMEVTRDDGKIFKPDELDHFTTDQFQSRTSTGPSGTILDFQCKDCNKIFASGTSLRIHVKKSHGYELKYVCPKCPNLEFARKTEYIRHRDEVHGHICETCGRRYNRVKSLFAHYTITHKMKLTYTCPLCKKVFNTIKDLSYHRKREHRVSREILSKLPPRDPQTEEEKEWTKIPCSECGKCYLSGQQLDYHLTHQHQYLLKRRDPNLLPPRKKCYFCWRNFHLDQRRSIHVKMDHPDKMKIEKLLELQFPCELCSGGNVSETNQSLNFQSCELLRQHYETEHQNKAVYVCGKCQLPFLSEEALQKHAPVHIHLVPKSKKKEAYRYQCWFCWDLFPNDQTLREHLQSARRHKLLKFEFPCDVEECEHNLQKPFASVTELNKHLSNCHSNIGEIHKCPNCSWGFISKDLLTIHKLNHVRKYSGVYKCPVCKKACKQLQSLKNHYNVAHDIRLNLEQCPHCPIKVMTSKDLSSHLMAEHPETSLLFHCDQCGKTFTNLKALNSHLHWVHEEHKCPEPKCGAVFNSLAACKRHKNKMHGSPTEKCLCTICGKVFLDRGGLRVHMQIHGERIHKCPCCPQRFKNKGNMKQHVIRVHEKKKERPPPKFPCSLCHKGFARKDGLDDHIRVKHTQETRRVWSCVKCGMRFSRPAYLTDHVNGNRRVCMKKIETMEFEAKAVESTHLSENELK